MDLITDTKVCHKIQINEACEMVEDLAKMVSKVEQRLHSQLLSVT